MATSTAHAKGKTSTAAAKPATPAKTRAKAGVKAPPKAAAAKRAAAAPHAPAPRPAAEAQVAKPAKRKLVRDSFTIPRDEYGVIEQLKLRAAKLGRIAKKSELLRAGLKQLAAASDASLLSALEAVPPLKTGRPKKGAARPG